MYHDTIIRVRYAETDQMGIVYHANYFVWFEIGRTEFFRSLGLDYKALEEKDVMLPVINVECSYGQPARYDDEIIIRTRLEKLKGVRIKYKYEILRKENEDTLAEGYTEHAFVNKNLNPVNFRKKFTEVWQVLQESMVE